MRYPISRRKALVGLSAVATLPLVGCASNREKPWAKTGVFAHGVASGDPDQNSVVIWTRIKTSRRSASGKFIVAEDEQLQKVVKRGKFSTNASRDMTVKLVINNLSPGKTYYYAFKCDGETSITGRTRTLPEGNVERLGFAVASCSNYPFGYFNAYEAIALDSAVDFVVHLGDYLYEYGVDGYGGKEGAKLGREHKPATEVVSLGDYRQRHAQYKADPASRAMHAAHPLILIWDDHESTNNAWRGGAENHQPETEGDWLERRAASLQAYYEWMPVREPGEGIHREQFWRHYRFGDLASLVTLETRHTGRDKQLDFEDFQALLQSPEGVDAFLTEHLGAPDRHLLSPEMEAFLAQALRASVQDGQTWRIIGNPIPMARSYIPRVTDAHLAQLGIDESHDLYEEARTFQALGSASLPMYLDAWDGYPWARERFYQLCRDAGADDLLVLTGDSHSFWQNQLFSADGQPMGLELGTSGITSPSAFSSLGQEGAALMDTLIAERSPEILWTEGALRGYLRLVLTPEKAGVDYVGVSTITDRDYLPVSVRQIQVVHQAGRLRYS